MNNKSDLNSSQSIMDVLNGRSLTHPDREVFSHIHFGRDEGTETEILTYRQLKERAMKVAAILRLHNDSRSIAILLYPPGLDFIVTFFGCLYAGVIAVPAYPPFSSVMVKRFKTIVQDCRAQFLLSTDSIIHLIKPRMDEDPGMRKPVWISTDNPKGLSGFEPGEPARSHGLAFIQYTSGSTSTPKGVGLTHRNLIENSRAIQAFFKSTEESRGVFWLPQYHDMGLIGGVLQTIFCGGSSALFSPLDFLRKPLRWLQTVSSYKATISGGPNFAYDLCVRKVTDDQLETLDLSTWKLAFNGAEPVRNETMMRFHDTFKRCGFRYEALYPCYGLAESTLIVSGGEFNRPPIVAAFDKGAMNDKKVIPANGNSENQLRMVSCGKTLPGHRMVIVNPETKKRCPPSEIGEIWVKSPSNARFYLNRPDETVKTFHAYIKDTMDGPYLRTGDLGFIYGGELFIAGRLKDMMIIRGKNYYPNDIEVIVEKAHDACRPGCGAVFSVEEDQSEKLVIVQEIKNEFRAGDHARIRDAVTKAVMKYFNLPVHDVVFLKQNAISKTSSGKIQRYAVKQDYLRSIEEDGLVKSMLPESMDTGGKFVKEKVGTHDIR